MVIPHSRGAGRLCPGWRKWDSGSVEQLCHRRTAFGFEASPRWPVCVAFSLSPSGKDRAAVRCPFCHLNLSALLLKEWRLCVEYLLWTRHCQGMWTWQTVSLKRVQEQPGENGKAPLPKAFPGMFSKSRREKDYSRTHSFLKPIHLHCLLPRIATLRCNMMDLAFRS